MAEYFAILRRSELWPSTQPFTRHALSDIELQFKNAQTDCKHQCGAGDGCPLRRELNRLSERVQRVLEDMGVISLENAAESEV